MAEAAGHMPCVQVQAGHFTTTGSKCFWGYLHSVEVHVFHLSFAILQLSCMVGRENCTSAFVFHMNNANIVHKKRFRQIKTEVCLSSSCINKIAGTILIQVVTV
jgi:hypothetical protein